MEILKDMIYVEKEKSWIEKKMEETDRRKEGRRATNERKGECKKNTDKIRERRKYRIEQGLKDIWIRDFKKHEQYPDARGKI